ncbi:MAG TPA: helix-turn-helix transcriptional regulator [Alphaproteobacteria bacterium]|nr:helix-turn-helix transcriptional regulator [Alphaproteobacteria bacterium]
MPMTNYLSVSQIRAARAILNWSQEELATATKLSVATIRKLELGYISPREETTRNIRRAFEDAELEFLDPDGVRRRPEEIRIYQGHEGGRAFYDDVYETLRKSGGDMVILNASDKTHFRDIIGDYCAFHTERMAALCKSNRVKKILTEDRINLLATDYVEYRYMSKHYIDPVPFYIYGNKYAIIMTEVVPGPKIMVIESRNLADAYRRQFYSMWDKAVPLNPPAEKPITTTRRKSR